MQGHGFEKWRLSHVRYSTPRSIGYLTGLLKPQLDEQKFEESFATWEFQLSRYEQDNSVMQSRLQNCSMRQKDHYSNIYKLKQETSQHMHRSDQW